MIELGGNITLSGFNDFDSGSMVIVKKIVGNYGKKFADLCKEFQNLSVNLKKVHEREMSELYEIHAKVTDKGNLITSQVEDRNLFVALDNVLKKVENQIN